MQCHFFQYFVTCKKLQWVKVNHKWRKLSLSVARNVFADLVPHLGFAVSVLLQHSTEYKVCVSYVAI